MAYSEKRRWAFRGGIIAFGLCGIALLSLLARNHVDPIILNLSRGAFSLIVIGMAILALRHLDEVRRQTGQKQWFWGSMIGFAAMLPVVILLQTQKSWLDAAMQLIFRHPGMPPLYFSLGVMLPVLFQSVSALVLKLLDILSRGSQP